MDELVYHVTPDEYEKLSIDIVAATFLEGKPCLKLLPPPEFDVNGFEKAVVEYIDNNQPRRMGGIKCAVRCGISHVGDRWYGLRVEDGSDNPFDFGKGDQGFEIDDYCSILSHENLMSVDAEDCKWTKTTMLESFFDRIDEDVHGIRNAWNLSKMVSPLPCKSETLIMSGNYISPITVEPFDMPKISYLLPYSSQKLWMIISRKDQALLNMRLSALRGGCDTRLLHNNYVTELENFKALGIVPVFILQKPNEFMTCYQNVSYGYTIAEEVHFHTKSLIPTMIERKRCVCPAVVNQYTRVPIELPAYAFQLEKNIMSALNGPNVYMKAEFGIKRVKELGMYSTPESKVRTDVNSIKNVFKDGVTPETQERDSLSAVKRRLVMEEARDQDIFFTSPSKYADDTMLNRNDVKQHENVIDFNSDDGAPKNTESHELRKNQSPPIGPHNDENESETFFDSSSQKYLNAHQINFQTTYLARHSHQSPPKPDVPEPNPA
uniref:CABIT domain-containing protein n=1 Tax=Panagrolaimus sp. ES5 TaxID=591445 RepID=A0AC34G6L5_9BILA